MSHGMAALSIGMMLIATSVAGAQSTGGGGNGGGGFAERRMQRLLQGITLSADQQKKLDSITAKYRAQLPPFTPGTPPDSATREKMRTLFANQDEEIRTVLAPDQQKVWDQNVSEMRNRMRQRAPGNR